MRFDRGQLFVAPLLLALGCSSAPTSVIVKVTADPGVTGVYQLQATLSNAEGSDEKTFPRDRGGALTFETAFSLTLDSDRTGALDVALSGLASGGALVAHGDGSVQIDPGHTVTLPITLHEGPSTCGDGVVDAGEECDDGDRITNGTCDYRCRRRDAGTGGGGGGGGAGAGGRGGGTAGIGGGAAGAGGAGRGGNAGGSCTTTLLTNGNFDQGATAVWTPNPPDRPLINTADDISTTAGITLQAFSAPYVAWLGYDLVNTEITLRQPFTIPLGTLSLTVTGYRQVRTDESGCACDYGYVDLTVGGTTLPPLQTWSAYDAATGWMFFSSTVDLAPLPGQTGEIQLRAVMDDGVNTSFFFDSVSVTARRCP
jgi:cysteine-rich repeat protein